MSIEKVRRQIQSVQKLRNPWSKQVELTTWENALSSPKCKQYKMLQKIPEGHQGILRCHMRAQAVM